jgi:hypothetical protein
MKLMPGERQRPSQTTQYPLGDLTGVSDPGNDRQQDGEFIASQAGDGVSLAHSACEPLGGPLQGFIARTMAHRVVDQLEAVQIQEYDGQRLSVTTPLGESHSQAVAEQFAIG